MRLLLVGEHVLLLEMLQATLEEAMGAEVRTASRPPEIAQMGRDWQPDVVVLDTMDVKASREQALSARGSGPGCRSVVIAPNDPAQLLAAVRLGARGFLPRDCTSAQLVHCIEAVLRGDWAMPRTLVEQLVVGLLASVNDRTTQPMVLTERERRILAGLSTGADAVGLAALLGVSVGTVRTDIRVLLQKFGVKTRAQLVAKAMRLGAVNVERRA